MQPLSASLCNRRNLSCGTRTYCWAAQCILDGDYNLQRLQDALGIELNVIDSGLQYLKDIFVVVVHKIVIKIETELNPTSDWKSLL